MIARNPYTIKTSYVSAVSGEIDSGTLASTTYNIGYYDDTKVWEAIDEIEEQVDGIENSMATKQWVEDKHYLTEHQDLSSYATKNWVEDKHYLTEHQDLSSYATFNDISDMAYVTAVALENASYVTALTDSQMNELFPIEI